MRAIIICLTLILLSSCAAQPSFDRIPGGTRMSQHGVSFVPPTNKVWSVLLRYSYQTTLAMYGDDPSESLITQVSVFNIDPQKSKEAFLLYIQKKRAEEPDTGRYELIEQSLKPYSERKEICVWHRTSSKDFGAKREGVYTIFETLGMYCIHPSKPNIGIFVELSRKAPLGHVNKSFDSLGEQLLRSVIFNEFRS